MTAPFIISTWSFGQRGNAAAWPVLVRGGSSLDAVEAACIAVERDPQVDSVGYGGLPDSTGRVSLDGCVMLGPNRCGSVCAVRQFMHPVSIARRVMDKTNHVMLAGDGADAFAAQQGFSTAELLAPEATAAYEKWKSDHQVVDQSRDKGSERSPAPPLSQIPPPRPIDRGDASDGRLFAGRKRTEADWKHHDTIGVLAIDNHGVLAGACSTSGTPFKTPGRVGDSPIIGHGLYVDPKAGAAVATGSGELIMGICGSFLAVEMLRRGATPLEAAQTALRRIMESHELRPEHQVAFIALKPDGTFASAALRDGYKTSLRDERRNVIVDPDAVMLP